VDVSTEAVNETLTLNRLFGITGHKIKVVGDDAAEVVTQFASERSRAGSDL
jgi:hypothetical protein